MPIRRDVLAYEGRYDVADTGEVRSLLRRSPRTLRPGKDACGYPLVVLTDVDGRRRTRRVHTLVAEAFHGPRPHGMQVRHLNGVPADCRAENLAWGTASENIHDQVSHSTHHHAAKTHCPAGHAYTPANTYVNKHGGRECRRCHADRERNRRAARCP
ncbi:NUMOD4 motif-containing HNH endonuclease [Glycomyces tenuis]|uniref:HNH endonuclease signature motif containing protein n=1 Tax=Glycomyces tenuis TaxID=58116 RepID=UPI00047A6296